ncbi:hypothetical protein Godav_004977, partial [Gossypium davidsonii]|nr:hypothetical protein [Gossypium davidsonii]
MPPPTSTVLLLPLLPASNHCIILLPSILLHQFCSSSAFQSDFHGGELMEAKWCGRKQGAKEEEEWW